MGGWVFAGGWVDGRQSCILVLLLVLLVLLVPRELMRPPHPACMCRWWRLGSTTSWWRGGGCTQVGGWVGGRASSVSRRRGFAPRPHPSGPPRAPLCLPPTRPPAHARAPPPPTRRARRDVESAAGERARRAGQHLARLISALLPVAPCIVCLPCLPVLHACPPALLGLPRERQQRRR